MKKSRLYLFTFGILLSWNIFFDKTCVKAAENSTIITLTQKSENEVLFGEITTIISEAPEMTTEEEVGGTTEAAPAGTTEEAGGTTEAAPAVTTEEEVGGTTEAAPAMITKEEVGGTTEAAPAGTTEAAPAGTTEAAPAVTSEEEVEGTTEAAPAVITEAAGGTTEAAPAGTTEAAPAVTSEEVVEGTTATPAVIITLVDEEKFITETMEQSITSITSVIIASDNFLRGTVDSIGYADTGQLWEELSGNWAISNNQAYEITGVGVNLAVLQSSKSNGEVSAIFANSVGNPRLIFRALDVNNYWYVAWHSPSQTLQLYKRMDGVSQYMGGWFPTQAGSDTRVVLNGSDIKLYADNTMFLNLNDTFNQYATKHGIGNTASTQTKFTSFRIVEEITTELVTEVSDTFLRGTVDTLGYADTGQTWEELSGNWAISNNQAFETTGSGVNLTVVNSGYSDGEVSAVFRNSIGNPRLIFRALDVNNYWYVAWHSPSQTLQLYKRMDGVSQYMGGWFSTQAGSETRVILNGNDIKVYADNTLFLNMNDTFNQFATKHGIGNNASTETRFSRFRIKGKVSEFTSNVIVSDVFLRGTVDTLGYADTGQTWEELNGNWAINNNEAFETTGSGVNLTVVNGGYSDGEVSAIFANSVGNPRLIFRALDVNNYWYVAWHSPSQTLQLYKRMDGVSQYMGGWFPTQAGSETRVVLSGSDIKVYAGSTMFLNLNDTFNQYATKHGIGNTASTETKFSEFKIISFEELNYPNTLIASLDNMLVNYNNGSLSLSTDGGATYSKSFSISEVSIIKYVRLFENGAILFADHQKVYYSYDWQSYYESIVLDIDGLPFIPVEYDNFTAYKNGTIKKIVNGVDMAVWGSYSTEPGIEYTDNIRVWYSTDYGRTVKTAYIFNTPTTLPTRHVHIVDFNPIDETFWLQTGDEPLGNVDMSHWIKGNYNMANDTWNWVDFAAGTEFKSTNMIFYNGYVYWSWDVPNGGIVRAPIATMDNVLTHEILFRTPNDSNFIIIGPSGDIAVFQTVWGGTEKPRTLYYAPDGVNFVRIVGDMPNDFYNVNDAQYQTFWPINNNGKILAGIQALSLKAIRDWGRQPSIFIDDVIRENGYPNAFRIVVGQNIVTLIDGGPISEQLNLITSNEIVSTNEIVSANEIVSTNEIILNASYYYKPRVSTGGSLIDNTDANLEEGFNVYLETKGFTEKQLLENTIIEIHQVSETGLVFASEQKTGVALQANLTNGNIQSVAPANSLSTGGSDENIVYSIFGIMFISLGFLENVVSKRKK